MLSTARRSRLPGETPLCRALTKARAASSLHFLPTVCCIDGEDRVCCVTLGPSPPSTCAQVLGFAATCRPFALRVQDEPPQRASACPACPEPGRRETRHRRDRRVASLASTALSAASSRKPVRNAGWGLCANHHFNLEESLCREHPAPAGRGHGYEARPGSTH